MITNDDPILATAQCDLPYAYVVYDHQRAAAVKEARAWLEQHDIILAGRYSEWEYYNSDHAFLAGKKAAEQVKKLREERIPAQPPELTIPAKLALRSNFFSALGCAGYIDRWLNPGGCKVAGADVAPEAFDFGLPHQIDRAAPKAATCHAGAIDARQ
jgi:hypothetical protein